MVHEVDVIAEFRQCFDPATRATHLKLFLVKKGAVSNTALLPQKQWLKLPFVQCNNPQTETISHVNKGFRDQFPLSTKQNNCVITIWYSHKTYLSKK